MVLTILGGPTMGERCTPPAKDMSRLSMPHKTL